MLKEYTTDAYTKVVTECVREFCPEVVLFGASSIGRDLAPRCAARLHTGLCADCTHLDVDMRGYIQFLKNSSTLNVDAMKWDVKDVNLKMTRPAFGGHLMATIVCPRFRPAMATVRPGVMKKSNYNKDMAKRVQIITPDFYISEDDLKTQVIHIVKETRKTLNLTDAEVIVSVGRGIGKNVEKGIELATQLSEVL